MSTATYTLHSTRCYNHIQSYTHSRYAAYMLRPQTTTLTLGRIPTTRAAMDIQTAAQESLCCLEQEYVLGVWGNYIDLLLSIEAYPQENRSNTEQKERLRPGSWTRGGQGSQEKTIPHHPHHKRYHRYHRQHSQIQLEIPRKVTPA